MANFTKIGTSMLHMDDIEAYLALKNFAYKSDTVTDVDHVGGVDADLVAVAYNKEDRTTVRNAKLLDGKNIDYFLSAKDGSTLVEDTVEIKNTYNTEIKNLKDEVNQLRMELAKAGYVNRIEPYSGFYDPFRRKSPMHMHYIVATANEDSKASALRSTIVLNEEDYSKFEVGDHIIVASKSIGKSTLVEVVELMDDGLTIRFSPETEFNIQKEDAVIYRSKGSIIDGKFVFGEIIPIRPGSKQLYTSLDDDTHWSTRRISKPNTGFGYTFRIPKSYQRNYLAKAMIKVKKVGEPGPLKAYVINEKDLDKWKNPSDALDSEILIAESKPLIIDNKLDFYLAEFDFFNPNMKVSNTRTGETVNTPNISKVDANPANYPLLTNYDNEHGSNSKVRYCLIIEATGELDNTNYYEVVFLGNSEKPSKDLQLNNTTYEYSYKSVNSPDLALTTNPDINNTDLYYGITLIEAVKEEFTPFDNGIYTAKFKSNKELASSMKLMLRIAREGIFHVTSEAGVKGSGDFPNNANITIRGEEAYDNNGFYNFEKKDVVIGTTIRKLSKVNNNNLTIEKGLRIEPNDIIYPVGYKVALKAKRVEWDPEKCRTMVLDSARFDLPLKEVLRDTFKEDPTISDRLIFEAEFKDENKKPKYFNEFELEIYWEKTSKELNPKLIGAIKDLVVSLDKNI